MDEKRCTGTVTQPGNTANNRNSRKESNMGEHTHTHQHSVTCPVCGGTISADTQMEMIKLVQTHAKEEHGKDLSREKVLEMERTQAEK
ncbi:MAG: DUF1059 domain-containing protein [Anaerolineae bacterium]